MSDEKLEKKIDVLRILFIKQDRKLDSGGEKEDVREGNTLNSGIEQPTTDSKPPEPIRYVTIKHDGNAKSEAKLRLEPREDDTWTKDENKPQPLKIDINGIRIGKLIVVKREDLKRWKKIFDLPYAEFVVPHPDGRFESDYIKEEYQIE